MDLCGVPPAALTYFRVIFACMKARRLGDTLYYWHRMQRAGIVPDVSALLLASSLYSMSNMLDFRLCRRGPCCAAVFWRRSESTRGHGASMVTVCTPSSASALLCSPPVQQGRLPAVYTDAVALSCCSRGHTGWSSAQLDALGRQRQP
jgi:pentatricopeptide repeat protein